MGKAITDRFFNFTKQAVDALPIPEQRKSKQTTTVYYHDKGGSQSVSGLALGVTHNGAKSFYVNRRVNGTPKRIKIGRYPDLKIPQARQLAQQTLLQVAMGEDPAQLKKRSESENITLQQMLSEYLSAKDGKLKPRTISDYQKALNETWSDYLDKPLSKITRESVKKRYEQRGKQSKARTANAMRVLRALFNYAKGAYHDEGMYRENPVDVLHDTGTWHRVKRKKTFIDRDDLPAWWQAVQSLDGLHSDYFTFLLMTGVRAGEANALQWADVNLKQGSFTIRDPKNGETVTLPLADHLVGRLARCKNRGELVFPEVGEGREAREKAIAVSGVKFTRHDLRRTFLTIGESLDIGFLTLKRLANHKTQDADVTSGFIVSTQDRKREAANRIAGFILEVVSDAQ